MITGSIYDVYLENENKTVDYGVFDIEKMNKFV